MGGSHLLAAIRVYAREHGHPPTLEQIREAADFTRAGGTARLCKALQAVAAEELKQRVA